MSRREAWDMIDTGRQVVVPSMTNEERAEIDSRVRDHFVPQLTTDEEVVDVIDDLFRRRLKPAPGPLAVAFRAALSAFVKARRLDGDPQRFATMPRKCPECGGSGVDVGEPGYRVTCTVCEGKGAVR